MNTNYRFPVLFYWVPYKIPLTKTYILPPKLNSLTPLFRQALIWFLSIMTRNPMNLYGF